jgi:hypothetical protein
MKYLKKFEMTDDLNDEEFSVGDIVYCIDGAAELDADKFYEIEDINKLLKSGITQLRVCDVPFSWSLSRFRKCTPREIKRVELNKKMNKYNL